MTRLSKIVNPQRKPCPSDLSDAEWAILKPLVSVAKGFGHPVEVDFRSYSQRHFLRATNGMPMGNAAPRSPTLHHCVRLLSKMAIALASGNKCTIRSANNSEHN